MKLAEAIKTGKSIVPENREEFEKVLAILEKNNIPCHSKEEGMVATLCDDNTYFIGPVYFSTLKLAANEFILNNQ